MSLQISKSNSICHCKYQNQIKQHMASQILKPQDPVMSVMYAICMTHVQKVLNSCWLSFILYISLFHSLGNNELSPNSLYKIQYRVNKTCITKFIGKLENPSAIMMVSFDVLTFVYNMS